MSHRPPHDDYSDVIDDHGDEYDDEYDQHDEHESLAPLSSNPSDAYSHHPPHQTHAGLTKLLGNPNAASIAANPNAFGTGNNSGVREGMELENDSDEEIEIDSDLENELHEDDDPHKQQELEQPQKWANWCFLYIIGVITCMACEFLFLLPAYYTRLFVVALLYLVLWISFASCAVHMSICPGKRKTHSTLALALYAAALAGFAGGMSGAYYYKQAWYFDQMDSAYNRVNPHVSPLTGIDTSSSPVSTTPSAAALINPTFLEFDSDPTATNTDGSAYPLASYVNYRHIGDTTNATIVGVYVEGGTTYCAAPITHTHVTADWSSASKETAAPKIFYWAIGEDCCGKKNDGSAQNLWANCKYWGDNNPTITRDIVDFSAEIYEDPLYVPYREAVRAYLQTSLINENHDGGAESYLVEVMTLSDHYDRQNARRWKAWVCLLVSAACWPILVAMLHALLWLIKQVKDACAKDPQRMA